MIGDLKEILRQLNSPSDWAVVGAAAIAGFVADAAINIVPLPIFTPGVCGVVAAGSALSAKRGWEARAQSRKNRHLLEIYSREADRIAEILEQNHQHAAAETLRFQIVVADAEGNPEALRAALDKAVALL